MTIAEILKKLPSKKREDALWLFSALLGISKGEVLLESRRDLVATDLKKWKRWWARREKGEPLQYVCERAPFYGREFFVSPNVLIPRPETERLVELSLDLLQGQSGARVLDIGTGSGAIAITMKLENPELDVVGADISARAISVARKNAAQFGLESLRLEKHDLFSGKLQREHWQLVVSNPPYLEFGKDHISLDVKKWEPRIALEPALKNKNRETSERAAWCGEGILLACEKVRPAYTALELSPRVALYLERRWKKHSSVKRIWREADLAGRKRFLLLAWNERL